MGPSTAGVPSCVHVAEHPFGGNSSGRLAGGIKRSRGLHFEGDFERNFKREVCNPEVDDGCRGNDGEHLVVSCAPLRAALQVHDEGEVGFEVLEAGGHALQLEVLDVEREEHVAHECGVAVGALQINKLVGVQRNGLSSNRAISVDVDSDAEVLVRVAGASGRHRNGSLLNQFVVFGDYSMQLHRRAGLDGGDNTADVLLAFDAAGENGGDKRLLARYSVDKRRGMGLVGKCEQEAGLIKITGDAFKTRKTIKIYGGDVGSHV